MKYSEYVKVKDDGRQYVIGGSYFTYKGVQYGKGTKIQYTFDFHKRVLTNANKNNPYWRPEADYRMNEKYYTPKPAWFSSIYYYHGNERWVCGMLAGQTDGMKIVPDRDFKEILVPVYYVEPPTPKELAHQRFKDGTWVNYIFNGMFPGYVILMLFAILAQPAQMISGWIVLTAAFAWYTYLKISGREP